MSWQNKIRTIPDWPKPGILFRDITPLLADPQAFAESIEALAEVVRPWRPALIAGTEARGFIFAAALSLKLGAGFIPIRKKGKLPAATIREEYSLEYGTDSVEMHADAAGPGTRVVLVDDVLATGGTAAACLRLIRKTGAELCGAAFLIELSELQGRKKLPEDVPTRSLIVY